MIGVLNVEIQAVDIVLIRLKYVFKKEKKKYVYIYTYNFLWPKEGKEKFRQNLHRANMIIAQHLGYTCIKLYIMYICFCTVFIFIAIALSSSII